MTMRVPEALGQADSFLKVQERISKVALVNRPVLIVGERGTGKELAAARLHYLSRRWQNPFVTLNCAALNPSVLESELFGHEAGAFTGATRQRKGRFEMAQEGTLFLDEIGNMPMIVQEKILRVIEYRSFERVGGSAPVSVDVRIIAATNADLPALVGRGVFKPDLLDRLSFEVIVLPPLRKRRDDIILLARHFAMQMSIELKLDTAPQFSDRVLELLTQHDWPGNIRELKNAVERAVYQNPRGSIDAVTINPFEEQADEASESVAGTPVLQRQATVRPEAVHALSSSAESVKPEAPQSLTQKLKNLEKQLLQEALEKSRFNQKKAAEFLDISYHQLRGLYRKHFPGTPKNDLRQP